MLISTELYTRSIPFGKRQLTIVLIKVVLYSRFQQVIYIFYLITISVLLARYSYKFYKNIQKRDVHTIHVCELKDFKK